MNDVDLFGLGGSRWSTIGFTNLTFTLCLVRFISMVLGDASISLYGARIGRLADCVRRRTRCGLTW